MNNAVKVRMLHMFLESCYKAPSPSANSTLTCRALITCKMQNN